MLMADLTSSALFCMLHSNVTPQATLNTGPSQQSCMKPTHPLCMLPASLDAKPLQAPGQRGLPMGHRQLPWELCAAPCPQCHAPANLPDMLHAQMQERQSATGLMPAAGDAMHISSDVQMEIAEAETVMRLSGSLMCPCKMVASVVPAR